MELDTKALETAAFEYAKSVMWDRKPQDVAAIQGFSAAVQEAALFHTEFVAEQDRDPNLVTECVRYLAVVHAIPPLRENLSFVEDALAVLVELACPNAGVTEAQSKLFKEIRRGMEEAESDAAPT